MAIIAALLFAAWVTNKFVQNYIDLHVDGEVSDEHKLFGRPLLEIDEYAEEELFIDEEDD